MRKEKEKKERKESMIYLHSSDGSRREKDGFDSLATAP